MNKYLMVISRYADLRQNFFDEHMSVRNREYCKIHDFQYIEIKDDIPLELFRQNPTWWKFTLVRDMIESGILKEGDILTHLDADMVIYNTSIDYSTKKSFSYSIDSGNTHCMGNYSIKINDWSIEMIDLLLDDNRFNRLNNVITRHDYFGHFSSFWQEFREQASWYSLCGIKRHSQESFWGLPNYGWHSAKTDDTIYSIDDLNNNVEILPTAWNVTEMEGESDCVFLINKVDKKDVFIRHFAGGQPWRKEWFEKIL